jgi:hypothetical protein
MGRKKPNDESIAQFGILTTQFGVNQVVKYVMLLLHLGSWRLKKSVYSRATIIF